MNLRVIATSLVVLMSSLNLSAQAPHALPDSEFATAKTVYLAYAGAPIGIDQQMPMTQFVITGVQQAIQAKGRYALVARPADADLSLRLSIESGLGIRLAIFDTKTGMLLWTIDEPFNVAVRKATVMQNINSAALKIVSELNALASAKTTTDPSSASANKPADEGKK